MSEAAHQDGSFANTASLRVRSGPLAGPVLTRLVSMMLARANCPIDRLDDAMLVCETVSAHAPTHASDGRLAFTVATGADGLQLHVGGLAEQGARRLVQDADLPGVGNVLERVVDELRFEPGRDSPAEELVLRMGFQASRARPA